MRSDPTARFESGLPVAGLGSEGRTLEDGVSFSGHERNHLFLNRGGSDFLDASGISGLDDPADGRAFAWLDFDRDGWLDVAVVNANRPLLQLFRNEMAMGRPGAHGFVAVRLEGAGASAGGSNRGGYGARVIATVDGATLVREHRAGEGFASQNAGTLLFGLGTARQAERIEVRWPGGRTQIAEDVAAGTRVTFHEPPQVAPAVTREKYAADPAITLPGPAPIKVGPVLELVAASEPAELNVLTTMATWCEACRGDLPHLETLRDAFPASEVKLLGIPVDEEDSRPMLEAWWARHRPAYDLRLDLSARQRDEVREQVLARLQREGIPASLVTDRAGRTLSAGWGVPTVSDLRRLQRRIRGTNP